MKFTLITAAFGFASSVVAFTPGRPGWLKQCLPQSKAESIVDGFITILEHYDVAAANATAQTLLADDYQEISDSILSLEGKPLGAVTFSGKQTYLNGVLNSPSVSGIETLEILVSGCKKIVWFWRITGIGSKKYPIKGFNLFTLNDAQQIETVDLEFNSIAWGLDTGFQVIKPSRPPTK